MDNDNTQQEFKSAEELHRFEAGIMLGKTAVYLLATGALINAVTGKEVATPYRYLIALYGLLISWSFLLITHRSGINLRGARRRAEELGEHLGFKLYSAEYRAPTKSKFVSRNTTRLICLFGSLVWILVLIRLSFFS